MTLKEIKPILRDYLQTNYDDQHLSDLLARAQDGKLLRLIGIHWLRFRIHDRW